MNCFKAFNTHFKFLYLKTEYLKDFFAHRFAHTSTNKKFCISYNDFLNLWSKANNNRKTLKLLLENIVWACGISNKILKNQKYKGIETI